MDARALARTCSSIAADKRAEDILILDVGDLIGIAECFVVATGRNRRQLKAIAEAIRTEVKQRGYRDQHAEGYGTDRWVLLDFGAVVVHLFDPEARAFYDLETLWADAPRVPLTAAREGRKGHTHSGDAG